MLSGFGQNWSPGETGTAVVTITNRTGFTIRDFYAETHIHSGMVKAPKILGIINNRFISEFENGHSTTMYIYLIATGAGKVRAHLHHYGELILEKSRADDTFVEATVIPD